MTGEDCDIYYASNLLKFSTHRFHRHKKQHQFWHKIGNVP